jgi:hypothetical protein
LAPRKIDDDEEEGKDEFDRQSPTEAEDKRFNDDK